MNTKWILSVIVAAFAIFIITLAEIDRNQGKIATPIPLYYQTQWLLAPYNLWISKHSREKPIPIFDDPKQISPETKILKDNWLTIRDEALAIYNQGLATTIENDLFFTRIAPKNKWKKFYIKWYTNEIDPEIRKLCPKTCELIEQVPGLHLAMFSILMPHSKIAPHRGVSRMAVRYHLGLSTPNDDSCFIEVDGTKYSWRDGEDVMFDDTFEHFVVNDTDKVRIILFADIERPMKTKTATTINHWVCKHIAPLTTRQNDKQEVMQQI